MMLKDDIEILQHELESYKRLAAINESIIRMMYMWLNNPGAEKLEEVFKELHIESVAIYGYSRLGQILLKQLCETDISVDYIIDRNRNLNINKKKVLHLDDDLPPVDAIIVSNVYDFDEIRACIEKNTRDMLIISLADILCML